MPWIRFAIAIAVAVGTLLAGCNGSDHTTAPGASAPATAPAAGMPDTAVTMNPADAADVTAVYLCDEDTRIDIIRDKVARVTLNDGKVVKLELVRGSVPKTYMDNGLSFIVGPEGAELGEDDPGGRSLGCRASTARR